MMHATLLLLALAVPADEPAKKSAPPAQVTITAETACMHCTFGVGDSCAVCLKLDETTPIVLEGKAAEEYFESRLTGTLLVVEGTLSVNKYKRLVLKSDKAHAYSDKDKGKAPDKRAARIEGVISAEKGGLVMRNGDYPITIDGIAIAKGKTVTASGILSLDKKGMLHLDAKVESSKDK